MAYLCYPKKDIYHTKQCDKCLKKFKRVCQCLNLMTLQPKLLAFLIFKLILVNHKKLRG